MGRPPEIFVQALRARRPNRVQADMAAPDFDWKLGTSPRMASAPFAAANPEASTPWRYLRRTPPRFFRSRAAYGSARPRRAGGVRKLSGIMRILSDGAGIALRAAL